jgi:molybdopterin adenylyltransferase
MRIGIITINDTRSFEDDDSGRGVTVALREFGFNEFETVIIASELGPIKQAIRQMSSNCAAILTIGGTGFSPCDVTPEATSAVLDRRADNLANLIRAACSEHNPAGHLGRGVAGMVGDALVVNLPGSPQAAANAARAIGPVLDEILHQLRGAGEWAGAHC